MRCSFVDVFNNSSSIDLAVGKDTQGPGKSVISKFKALLAT